MGHWITGSWVMGHVLDHWVMGHGSRMQWVRWVMGHCKWPMVHSGSCTLHHVDFIDLRSTPYV